VRVSFSALQRAENSSIFNPFVGVLALAMFQCSSASRKFLNRRSSRWWRRSWRCFSALQRAENSSIPTRRSAAPRRGREFQCSSASRKFLNLECGYEYFQPVRVSVLFSEPKIPQSPASRRPSRRCGSFSALQRAENSSIRCLHTHRCAARSFQCSSASRKFLNYKKGTAFTRKKKFQCSSASRKFLNRYRGYFRLNLEKVSVLFSEPKIPQWVDGFVGNNPGFGFSALQRAENSSIPQQ